jgi:hypothetical protein
MTNPPPPRNRPSIGNTSGARAASASGKLTPPGQPRPPMKKASRPVRTVESIAAPSPAKVRKESAAPSQGRH